MNPPLKITIATVTYNAAALIERTIASVEAQDYPYVQHVIVDGNSQDDTLEAVHHYQERNSLTAQPREINCLSEPDEGLYDAMNKALDMATGDYIVFLNAGDCLHDATTLAKVAAAAQQGANQTGHLPAVVYGNTNLVDAKGQYVGPRRLTPPAVLTWRSFRNGMLVCHQAFYARTDLARAARYDQQYRFSADFDWCIRLMRDGAKQHLSNVHTHEVLADYLNEGMTLRNHKASLKERFHIMCRHYGVVSTLIYHIWFFIRNIVKP